MYFILVSFLRRVLPGSVSACAQLLLFSSQSVSLSPDLSVHVTTLVRLHSLPSLFLSLSLTLLLSHVFSLFPYILFLPFSPSFTLNILFFPPSFYLKKKLYGNPETHNKSMSVSFSPLSLLCQPVYSETTVSEMQSERTQRAQCEK